MAAVRSKPIEDKILAGNPGGRKLNMEFPDYEIDERPACPATLTGEGRKEWDRLAPMLVEHGVLRKADLRAFEEFCEVLGELSLYKRLAKKERNTRTKMSYQDMVVKLRTQFRHMAQELGLTPSSRGTIKASRPKGRNSAAANTSGKVAAAAANVKRFFRLPS